MENTKIQWTTDTHNFWVGCKKISEGCKYCYMHRILEQDGKDGSLVRRTSDKYFHKPLHDQQGRMIFTCSMSDFFIEEADDWRDDAWEVIRKTPQHTWQILTKRPERIKQCLPADWGSGYDNVWLGVTVENQKNFHRVETLANIPAKLRFISAEPLLEEVDFLSISADSSYPIQKMDWVILGGESGNLEGKYIFRPCKVDWIEKAVHDIQGHSSAKVFVKQMGTHLAKQGIGSFVSKAGFIRNLYGDDFQRFPQSLQIREFPQVAETQ